MFASRRKKPRAGGAPSALMTHIPINHSDERKRAPPPPKNVPPCKWTSSVLTSEKRPDLAMGRRPIAISEESALVPIEEVRLLF
jgi:hypothetical protein